MCYSRQVDLLRILHVQTMWRNKKNITHVYCEKLTTLRSTVSTVALLVGHEAGGGMVASSYLIAIVVSVLCT